MSNKVPNSRRNLDIAIDRILGRETNPLQVRTLLANTIIGQLLPKCVVKGGSAIKLRYGDETTRFTRDLDAARHDELDDTEAPDYYISQDIVGFFWKLGFPDPKPIALMPIHHQIAQKLHALSINGSERAHDLIDLQVIAKNETIDLPLAKNVCRRLFNSRRQQLWPPLVTKNEGWDTLYESQTEGLDVFQSVDEAIIWANELIQSIDNAHY